MTAVRCLWVMVALTLLTTSSARATESSEVLVDRVIVRFEAAELGGPSHPHFIFERMLAFEARIEALAEEQTGIVRSAKDFEERHLRAALERHVTEEILVNLPVEPALRTDEIRRRNISAYLVLQQQVGGRQNLLDAAFAEGMEMEDLEALIERRARASLYLDRMVAPMLDPSAAELREVLRNEPTPFRGKGFDEVASPLRRWYVADRLKAALASFFRSARARIRIVILRE